MGNKTFLSCILINSKTTSSTLTKSCCFNSLARWYYLCNIVRTHPWLKSQTLFRSLDNTRFFEVFGAKETHFMSKTCLHVNRWRELHKTHRDVNMLFGSMTDYFFPIISRARTISDEFNTGCTYYTPFVDCGVNPWTSREIVWFSFNIF